MRALAAPAPQPAADVRVPVLQRKCACAGPARCRCDEPVQLLAEPGAPRAAPARGPLLVDDDAPAEAHQLRRTEFLDRLRPAVCAAADEELARVGRDTSACPYLERLFGHYATRSAAEVEQALVGYAPEAASATTATGYVTAVADRVRASTVRWIATGELPSGIGPNPTPGGVLGAVLGRFGALSGVAGLFAKREGTARAPGGDPATVRSRLRGGSPLDAGTRARMETALGHDFGQVRVHADPVAGAVARDLSARAFTVGQDVAFAPGEYRPGTLAGDAVLAHELAHVAQQRHAVDAPPTEARRDALEEDADVAAAHAVAAMNGLGERSLPRLRSGLRLQRCATTPLPTPTAMTPQEQTPEAAAHARATFTSGVCTPTHLAQIRGRVGPASVKIQKAVRALTPPNVATDLVVEHFGPQGPQQVDLIRSNFERALANMVSGRFEYRCVDRRTEPLCRYQPANAWGFPERFGVVAATNPPAASDSATDVRQFYTPAISWCGDPGSPQFLPSDAGYDWVHTMIHEYFHTLQGFHAAGVETYRRRDPDRYPGATSWAVANPDNYASFADAAP